MIFKIYKFRTMVQDAESIGGPSTALNDFRLTKIGRFLRKYKIDELPQLINVLKGDLSLIGPRPLLKEYDDHYNSFQNQRFNVMPGITGLSQIKLKNTSNWKQKFTYDVFYSKNICLKLDLLVLYLTLKYLIGIIFGTYLFSIKKNASTLFYLDIIACVSPIGIFFGRIANFINGELIGKTTNVFWGVIFPNVDMLPRHPSQIYEALLEGLVLFFILNTKIFKNHYKKGTCSFLFLIWYGSFRIISELFREPDMQLGYLFNLFSMGTILSFFMIIAGIIIFNILQKK